MAQTNELVVPRKVPLVVGAIYQLIPSMGGQYVRLTHLDRKYAYAAGYGGYHHADLKVRKYRWPEIVIKMVGYGTSGSALLLSGEAGYVKMIDGSRIDIME